MYVDDFAGILKSPFAGLCSLFSLDLVVLFY